jgi:hypothetical protein
MERGTMTGTFSITKVTGLPKEQVTSASHDQPSANGQVAVVTTGSTDDGRAGERRHLRLVRE